jgi:hypothetical protein
MGGVCVAEVLAAQSDAQQSELKPRDDTLAFPSEEQCDLGQCLLDSS